MAVPMVNIRVMRMSVRQGFMNVLMGVRLARINIWRMLVLVMFVMDVAVRMLQVFVGVPVFVTLAQMQPDADCHQQRSGPKRNPYHFA
jgi:hypothetical protein